MNEWKTKQKKKKQMLVRRDVFTFDRYSVKTRGKVDS